MNTATLIVFAALLAGYLAMPALPIVQVCAWNVGTIRVDPWRIRRSTIALARTIRSAWYRLFTDERGFASVDLMTGGNGKRRRDIDPPSVIHEGSTIKLPADPRMSLRQAVDWLEKMAAEEETVIVVSEQIDVYPWDGARALTLAIRQMFGFAQTKGSMFNPPRSMSVQTDVHTTESVAWGSFAVPGLDGKLVTSSTTNQAGQLVFQLHAEVRKRDEAVIHQLAELTREILKTESIYRGKAIRFAVDSDGNPKVPEFIDLSRVNADELVFSSDIEDQINTTIFAPLRRREWCKTLGIPFKRGVCLLGAYGVGKTLAVYVAAQLAKANGITFILVEDPEQLPAAMLLARQYAPAVLAAEDIDRVTRERNDVCNDIMDALDGVEAKDTDVMTLFTSNHADDIHEAMRRPGRIDTFIKVAAPDKMAVEKLIRLYGRQLVAGTEDVREACKLLDGQIPAVIREVVERAKLAAVARAEVLEDARNITGHDLVVAAKRLLMQLELFAAKPEADDPKLSRAIEVLGAAMRPGIVLNRSTFANGRA